MNNSSLKDLTWRWRQGMRQVPLHSYREAENIRMTNELYSPVQDENQAKAVVNELRENGIRVETKRTHSPYDVIPQGTLIVFASLSKDEKDLSEIKNIEKLKSYILTNGGKVNEVPQKNSILRNFMQNLFGRR